MPRAITEPLLLNGINAATGRPSLRLSRAALLDRLQASGAAPVPKAARRKIDVCDLAAAGWAIVFSERCPEPVRAALAPLIALRREQAAARDERCFKLLAGEKGYRAGETRDEFLLRQKVSPGPANPAIFPYYVLLIGGPDEIPFSFQHQLDVQHAVGRLAFDTPEEYARYAATVVAAEAGRVKAAREIVLWSPKNPDDEATELSFEQLTTPLAEHAKGLLATPGARPRCALRRLSASRATKAGLTRALSGKRAPAFLFTASHGIAFAKGHPLQRAEQGALLCQEWPGFEHWQGPVPESFYFAGRDAADALNVAGMISLHFACFSAGTPQFDQFSRAKAGRPARLARRPFVAALPQRLLAHPRGSALAVIGHVERAWTYSFFWKDLKCQTLAFECLLEALLDREPVGAAMESFAARVADLADQIASAAERRREFGRAVTADELRFLWSVYNDARCYALLGDPAVRLAV